MTKGTSNYLAFLLGNFYLAPELWLSKHTFLVDTTLDKDVGGVASTASFATGLLGDLGQDFTSL